MEIKVTRHDERLTALHVNTSDIKLANSIAVLFLKEMETESFEYKITSSNIWKKDTSQVKIEYSRFLKIGSPEWTQMENINSRQYSLVIKDNVKNKTEKFIDRLDVVTTKIIPMNIHKLIRTEALKIDESLCFNYYNEFEGEVCDLEYTITRLS